MSKTLFVTCILAAAVGLFASQTFPRDSFEHFSCWGLFVASMAVAFCHGMRNEV